VRAGDVLVELDREKAEYNLEQQRAALSRTWLNTARRTPAPPASRKDA
jgi:hypothetical protein